MNINLVAWYLPWWMSLSLACLACSVPFNSCPPSHRNFSANLQNLSGNLANSVSGIDLSGTSSKLTKGLSELQQSVKESIGRTDEDAVTELPEGETREQGGVVALGGGGSALANPSLTLTERTLHSSSSSVPQSTSRPTHIRLLPHHTS